jgi:hypothetical protein
MGYMTGNFSVECGGFVVIIEAKSKHTALETKWRHHRKKRKQWQFSYTTRKGMKELHVFVSYSPIFIIL